MTIECAEYSYLFPLNILFPLNKNLVIHLIIKHIINSYFMNVFTLNIAFSSKTFAQSQFLS